MESQKVWAPDINEGYVLGTVSDIGPNGLTVQTFDGKVCQYFPHIARSSMAVTICGMKLDECCECCDCRDLNCGTHVWM